MDTKAIREKILSLAVRGQLVAQDPSEEPAHMLLERIREEKQRLIREKKIRAPKQESIIYRKADGSFYERRGKEEHCIDDELPFEIPDSWEWVRLGSLMRKVASGSTPTGGRRVYQLDGIMFIRSQNVHNDGLRLDDVAYIDPSIHAAKKNSWVEPGDLLLNITGASIGRCSIVPENLLTANVNQHVLILRALLREIKSFIHLIMISPFVFTQIMSKQVGGTKEGLSAASASCILLPIPPLAEQKRIATSLTEMMRHLDCITVNQQAIQRDLKAIREKSLNMAIRGQLVPQDPTDEPAQKLLDRIHEEIQRLIKEKKIKAPKQESTIYRKADGSFYERIGTTETCIDDELPFTIPDSWEWVRLESIAQINPRNKAADDTAAAFIPMPLIEEGYSNAHGFEVRKWGDIKTGFSHFAQNDVVIAKITPCFQNRKSAIIGDIPNGIGAGTTELHVVRPFLPDVFNEYLLWLFKSPYFIESGTKLFTGTSGQQRISKDFVSSFFIPVPTEKEISRLIGHMRACITRNFL